MSGDQAIIGLSKLPVTDAAARSGLKPFNLFLEAVYLRNDSAAKCIRWSLLLPMTSKPEP